MRSTETNNSSPFIHLQHGSQKAKSEVDEPTSSSLTRYIYNKCQVRRLN